MWIDIQLGCDGQQCMRGFTNVLSESLSGLSSVVLPFVISVKGAQQQGFLVRVPGYKFWPSEDEVGFGALGLVN